MSIAEKTYNMARIKIDLPKSFIFSTSVTVRVTDLNYGGHVGNDTILSIAHEARMQWVKSIGFKDELSIDNTVGFVMSDAAVVYKSESFQGDRLSVKIGIEDSHKYGFDLLYEITNAQTGKEVARLKTGMIFMDYATRKIAKIPDEFADKLN